MKKSKQVYLGSLIEGVDTTSRQVEALRKHGYVVLKQGSLCQVFGDGDLPPLQKTAYRGDVWHPPKRDSLQLHLDTEKVINRVTALLREELHEMQNPDIKINYQQKVGHGHSLQILDQWRNEHLDIHVAATPWDQSVWLHWRLTHWTGEGKEILKEGQEDWPKNDQWDDEKMQVKLAEKILKAVREWLKEAGQ